MDIIKPTDKEKSALANIVNRLEVRFDDKYSIGRCIRQIMLNLIRAEMRIDELEKTLGQHADAIKYHSSRLIETDAEPPPSVAVYDEAMSLLMRVKSFLVNMDGAETEFGWIASALNILRPLRAKLNRKSEL